MSPKKGAPSLKVEVELFYIFREKAKGTLHSGPAMVEIPDGTSLAALSALLGLDQKIPKIVLLNGKACSDETVLKEGQSVAIFPPLDGG